MRLKTVILENFRRYHRPTTIPIDSLTAFIGRNDAGKSTVLEALDIFFEAGTVKIEPDDACTVGDARNVCIGAVFTNLPPEVDLDRGAPTSLAAEHLLNGDGDLELVKVFDCTLRNPGPKVNARALHPTAGPVSDLLQKSNTDLKRLVKEQGLEAQCNLTSNPSMRQALYGAVGDLELALSLVPLTTADGKNIWEAIKRRLPLYALFRSDRSSTDQDPEVQDPMKIAIQKALAESELAAALEAIEERVASAAEETAERTLEQLRESFPDLELASVLKPQFRPPAWANIFKLDLQSDDGIPLNKRGSGVRRLVLLSFFQAEAIRLRQERERGGKPGIPVIYAIEEPETSQHPDTQKRIIRAFCELAEAGEQVLLTTHVPGLAGLLPLESLRLVDTDVGQVRVRTGDQQALSEMAESLGVLPDPVNKPGVKVVVAVEGPTDIDALISFAKILTEAGSLPDFDESKVFWAMGGGTTLKDWVERRYLDTLDLPQVFLFDSDCTAAGQAPNQNKVDLLKTIRQRPNCQAYMTRKRMMENYVHPNAISRVSGGKITLPAGVNVDYDNIAQMFKDAFDVAKVTHGNALGFFPTDHQGQRMPITSGESHCKRIIAAYVMRHMTADEALDRGAYNDPTTGASGNEILDWLTAIRNLIQ